MTPQEARAIYDLGPDVVVPILMKIAKLEARIKELEDQLAKNSRNSSKPPSSDGLGKPAPKPAFTKNLTGNKPGGQTGHGGSTLKFQDSPDQIVELRPKICPECAHSLVGLAAESSERRQVLDLPPIKLETTEYRAATICCPACQTRTKADFPEHLTAPVQYGPRVRATALYLKDRHLVPGERVTEIMDDVFACGLSEGSLTNFQEEAAMALDGPIEAIREQLKAAPVVQVDETSCRVNGVNHWLHVACTGLLTLLGAHARRGAEGTKALGVLPDFGGVAVHDFWSAYGQFACSHAFCGAHLLRELRFVFERTGQAWAEELMQTLLAMNRERESATEARKLELVEEYRGFVEAGLEANPAPEAPVGAPKKRGRKAMGKVRSLALRLQNHETEVLSFFYDHRVPFTNNQAERDLRMEKVKQKISGSYRSEAALGWFNRIRSYLSTMRKQGKNEFEALVRAFEGRPFMPVPARP